MTDTHTLSLSTICVVVDSAWMRSENMRIRAMSDQTRPHTGINSVSSFFPGCILEHHERIHLTLSHQPTGR
jgi:hypothetical protein